MERQFYTEIGGGTTTQLLREYDRLFVREHTSPFGMQVPGQDWKRIYKNLPEDAIRGHIEQRYWIATRAGWYVDNAAVDIDHPEFYEPALAQLGLREGQYLTCTSPSWRETGSVHVRFPVRYQGEPPTRRRLQAALQAALAGLSVEYYPQSRRVFRLPFGRDQYIIDLWTETPLVHVDWVQAMELVKKLEEVNIEDIPRSQGELILPYRSGGVMGVWAGCREAEELWQNGLEMPSTTHEALGILAVYNFRRNIEPRVAARNIQRWIRAKHNGYSQDVNRGRWDIVDKEIVDWVRWVWGHYGCSKIYPDSTHNAEGWVVANDVRMIGQMFPGDIVNQRRMFDLMKFYRPRQTFDYSYIPFRQWLKVAGERQYKGFQDLLVQRNFLSLGEGQSYRRGSYPKRFMLHVKAYSHDAMLEDDGRAIQDFGQAVKVVFGSPQNIREALQLPERAHLRLMKSISQKESPEAP